MGRMKSEVYKLKINTPDELVAQMLNTIILTKRREVVLRRATQDLRKRITKFIVFNGEFLNIHYK